MVLFWRRRLRGVSRSLVAFECIQEKIDVVGCRLYHWWSYGLHSRSEWKNQRRSGLLFFKHISGAGARVSLLGSLSNHDDDGNTSQITLAKCVLTNLGLNWNQRFKVEYLSLYAHVVHATAKEVISRRGKNENACEMFKNNKCMCKACKTIVFFLLKLPYNVKLLQQRSLHLRHRHFLQPNWSVLCQHCRMRRS